MNFDRIQERSPRALLAFSDWARSKSVLKGWGGHLQTPVSIALPFELLVGPLMVFFREQDIVFGYHITKLGRSVVMVSRPDKHGHYKIVARTVPRVDPMVSWAYAFGQGFDYLEARINRVEDIPRHTETIIEDPDLILSNATGDHT